MQLSIIIVNFNVKYFLEQCLFSVIKATRHISSEIWVVDNASTDGSVEFLQANFPLVNVIANTRNTGFAVANNQALTHCKGKYTLYLNPDTLVAEDALTKTLKFLEDHPDAGAAGIRMVDGQGVFLPESKRSFPSPLISFFKLVGLTSLFPTSRVFAKYNLGYLDQHQNHEVDVLAGAFLMGRTHLLQKLNGFDEGFFMYGEDVDLSYRIQQAGYKNYYFAGSTIIHFKGESTKKGSLNYVRMFYQAMSIFVKKHYGGSKASVFRFFIQLAIWLRAGLSALNGVFLKTGLPIIDAILIYAAFNMVNLSWVEWMRHGDGYNAALINIAFPSFTLLFLLTATLAGMYDKKYKISKVFYASLVAILVMLAGYSLLPEKYRFSRGVILLGGMAATLFIVGLRWALLKLKIVENFDEAYKQQQTLVVGTPGEYNDVLDFLTSLGLHKRVMGRVAPNGVKSDAIFTLSQLPSVLKTIRIREIIFCEGYLDFKTIIDHLQKLPYHINIRFHVQHSHSIVGSDSKHASGEFVSADGAFELADPYQRRTKRLVDLALAFSILITFPVHLVLCGGKILYNAFLVISGKKTWIGYSNNAAFLPRLRKGVIATNGYPPEKAQLIKKESLLKIDEWYARNYHWLQDVKLVARHYKELGNTG